MKPLLAILLLALAVPCFAQDKFSYLVQLDISGPEILEGQIYSIMSREFSKMEGVRITKQSPDMRISIVVAYVEPVELYAISFLAHKPLYRSTIKELVKCQTLSDQEVYENLLGPLTEIQKHIIRTAGAGRLEEALQSLIAKVQRDEIDVTRDLWIKMTENMKRKNSRRP